MSNNIVLHNKLMEEGYIEAAAGKINQKLSELRESGNDRLCRRWIWELIQNANDCANPTVEIDIQHNNDTLTFSHTGKPFDYKSLMSLVTQISTKESTSKDATGKFGTGFITTHLLSEKVNIKGLFVDELNNKMNLNFLLDRSGKDIHEIKKQVINSLEALKNIHLESNKYEDQLGNGLTTTFSYDIKDANIKALNEGKQDFDKTVFFVLAFVNTINMVRYNDTVYKKVVKRFE
ncbi:sacsin N-terminal ATP-binding-like domain-containing protein [Bacillus cereus]